MDDEKNRNEEDKEEGEDNESKEAPIPPQVLVFLSTVRDKNTRLLRILGHEDADTDTRTL